MVLQACNDRTWEAVAGASPASGRQQCKSARPYEIPISKQLWGRREAWIAYSALRKRSESAPCTSNIRNKHIQRESKHLEQVLVILF